ncbi:MAG: PilZ domain-containing protein [Pseudomonadota bacterium]
MSENFNRRHSPNRRKTRVDAVMALDGIHYPSTILEISFQGMKIAAPVSAEPGSPITVFVLSHQIPAIIHWCKDGKVGVHLLERLDGQTLIALENAEDEFAAFR